MITGTLVADFEDFTDAAKNATKDLKDLEAEAARVESAVSKVTNVSPAGLNAAAAATKNVRAEASQLDSAMTQLAGRVAAVFTVESLVGFTNQIISTASHIKDVAANTDLTVEQVQRLQYVAGKTGTDLRSLASAAQTMTQQLGNENTGAAAALYRLGINAEQFNKLGTYDKLIEASNGLRTLTDYTEQSTAAAALFGPKWKEILGTLLSDMDRVAQQAPVWGDATVDSLARISDQWGTAKTQIVVWGGEAINIIQKFGYVAGQVFSKLDPEHIGLTNDEFVRLAAAVNDPLKESAAMLAIPKLLREMGDSLPTITLNTKALTEEDKRLTEQFAIHKKEIEETKKKQDDYAAAMHEVDTVGKAWRETLVSVSGEVLEGIKHYDAAGVSQKALAALYGLTEDEVKALVIALKNLNAEHKAEQESFDEAKASREEKSKAHQKALADYDAEVTKIQEADKTTRTYYEMLATNAAKAYDLASAHSEQYTTAQIENLRRESEAATERLANWSRDADYSIAGVKTAAEQTADSLRQMGEALKAEEADRLAYLDDLYAKIDAINNPVRKGGANQPLTSASLATFPSASSLTAAGMMPGSFLGFGPRGTMPTPADQFGDWMRNAQSAFSANMAPTPTVTMQAGAVQMNYPIMDDPQAMDRVGRLVGDAIMSRVTRPGTVV